jgi:hypothetical protein
MDNSKQNDFYIPNRGVTTAERYLYNLCKRTFLSLWSYPGLYAEPGKELCDVLIVFGDHIIVFSDKDCKFPETSNLQQDWNRWFNKAIHKSARQVWGAEKWIRNYPDKIFTDAQALKPLPFLLPSISKATIHLILVAHDGARRCAKEMGGSGSFMLRSNLSELENHSEPFVIGDLQKNKTFVHVLDDTSLGILLNKLDTISDFINYLSKKEKLFRSDRLVIAAGEEELLTHYLQTINDKQEHDFIFPDDTNIVLVEGLWEEYLNDERVKKQEQADRISYAWDHLIEKTNFHARTGTQYIVWPPGIQTSEKIARIFAKENRVQRRMLSKALLDLMTKTPTNQSAVRYFGPRKGENGTTYVFLLLPRTDGIIENEYREKRGVFLQAYCQVAKIRFPHAQDIVGIATEPDIEADSKSEDFVYFDASEWNDEREAEARQIFEDLKLDPANKINYYSEKEYPDIVSNDSTALAMKIPKNPRNKLCPCGAIWPDGNYKKYKDCHGK